MDSKFYISTIFRSYQEDIEINSQEDYEKKWHLVNSGEYTNTEEFWSIKLKLGFIDKKVHVPDIFTILPSSEGIYISRNLAQAIVTFNLTGFELNRVYGIKD